MESYFDHVFLVRILIQRGLGAIYFVAFLSALNQFKVLLGEKGLLPVPEYLKRVRFLDAPSIFHWKYSDRFFTVIAWTGIIFSLMAVFGISEMGPWWLSILIWITMYVLYLSIVNVGQAFYAFGWESMLLEAGFFASFLGPSSLEPSLIPVLILRWMLFRTEFGSGLIKLRNDPCWKKLTCLFYHHETQPLPNPLSWYFHHLPKWIHRYGVLFSNLVQTVIPFGLFFPQPTSSLSGVFIIVHQLLLIISGNYSWLNWLTVVLGLSAFSDSLFGISQLFGTARPELMNTLLYLLGGLSLALSIKPTLNFFARHQLMNYSYNPFHLVGSYGAFGTVTKERYEIILEGSSDGITWKPYEFKGKPGDMMLRPPQVAPYHLRLDWLMWFLPFSVRITEQGIWIPGHEIWFLRFVKKLLEGDAATLKLLQTNPWAESPPQFIRALFYQYQFTSKEERKETGGWWKRTLIDDYLSSLSLRELDVSLNDHASKG